VQQGLDTRANTRQSIFVPSNRNALIDILLARSVTGESPVKKKSAKKGKAQQNSKAVSRSQDAGEREHSAAIEGNETTNVPPSRGESRCRPTTATD